MAEVFEPNGPFPDIRSLVIRRENATDATLAGYFVNQDGKIFSPDGGTTYTYTGTVSTTPVTLFTLFSLTSAQLAGAVGFRGVLSTAGVIYTFTQTSDFSIPSGLTTAMGTVARFPIIATGTNLKIGRVAKFAGE